MKTLFYLMLVVGGVLLGCQKGPQRSTHTTLEALGRGVDLAEREYLAGVLAGRYRTNGFPETQAAYGLFQLLYSNAVWHAATSTNAIGIPPAVRAQADVALDQINRAKGAQ